MKISSKIPASRRASEQPRIVVNNMRQVTSYSNDSDDTSSGEKLMVSLQSDAGSERSVS